MLLIGRILHEQTMIGTLQILNTDFQLLIDLEAGIIHFTQRCCVFLQILQRKKGKEMAMVIHRISSYVNIQGLVLSQHRQYVQPLYYNMGHKMRKRLL